ncbi:hypothetical protein mvi_692 [Megavirus vitis]|nr:hypothetical protein mvi_692 [Megavirus vitis]
MITNIIELKSYIESFLSDNLEFVDIDISAKLRRPIRVFRTEYPNLYYFAYGLSEVYRLRLSKIKFEIAFHDLGPKTRKMFCDYSGVKLLPNADINTLNEICKYTNLRSWLDDLNNILLYLGGEREFISKHYDLSKKIHDDLVQRDNYKSWKNMEIVHNNVCNKYPIIAPHLNIKFADIYQNHYCEKYYLSIDISSANFEIMREIKLISEKTWQDYVSKFINHTYFGRLKKLRLIALSYPDLFPKKQTMYWRNITLNVLDCVLQNNIFTENDFINFNNDEIIFEITPDQFNDKKIACLQLINDHFPNINLCVSVFQLKEITRKNKKSVYVKIHQDNDKIEWKCVDIGEFLDVAKNFITQ